MKLTKIAALTAGVVFSFGVSTVFAADVATSDEVVAKVKEAAAELAKDATAGLAELNKKDGKFVWKDTYVFAYDCKGDKMVAHPMAPALVGQPVLAMKDKAKENAKELFKELCAAGEGAKGGWVEYQWTKPGVEGVFKKFSYAHAIEGSTIQVGAGIYDDAATVDGLNGKL
ncbi:cache domain-containing protein [Beggiatoa leptomitoformis]|uniref:Calcium:proton antiporter n=1 Tax=Beggiatoa leptomitoformis TaxID=288004 RepID=A0A2N9YGG8_9GAMM|nr:cache domain-containing protein [Beggiatoa leptomitoformis]ALG68116.1 calcium:proton antiporter [Beggiatoa leptomitoformis]AUI69587.1 calcium:proton antiporter [Beggiatoa leptomitoformis]